MDTPTPTGSITCDFDNSAAWTMEDFQKALQTIEKLRQEKRTQVAVAFGGYVEASDIARQLLTDVKAALAGGMSHSRSRLELAVSRHSTALNKLTFDAPPSIKTDVRLFDLVRYMRSELHQAELITDDEYAWLCSANPGEATADGSPSRERLESYDDLRAQLAASQAGQAKWQSEAARLSAEREHNANMAGMWQALAEGLAKLVDDASEKADDGDVFKTDWEKDASAALAAYEAAKAGGAAAGASLPEWQPIETAPTDGSQDIFIAHISDSGEIINIDFHALIETDYESWEIPQPYSYWASAFGNVEEPTHWAPMPAAPKKPASPLDEPPGPA